MIVFVEYFFCRSSGCHAGKLALKYNSLGIDTAKLLHDLIWFDRVGLQIIGYDENAVNKKKSS